MADQDNPPPAPPPAPASPEPAPSPTPPAPTAKTFTQEEVNRLLGDRAQRAADGARAQLVGSFKEFGIASVDDLAALVKNAHAAKQAELTELQKAQERTKQLEADLAQAKADAESRAEEVRRGRVFREANVVSEYEEVLGVLLDRARVGKPEFDERAWLENLKKNRPVFFGGSQSPTPTAPATTGVVYPQPPAAPQSPAPAQSFDARRASPDDLRRWEQSLGIAVPSGGRI
jgi:hypothetical protein